MRVVPAGLPNPLENWRQAAIHPLTGIYLRLPRRVLPARLARRVLIFVWACWLVGTALAVVLYPQAGQEYCTDIYGMTYCRPVLGGDASPLYHVDLLLGRLLAFSLLLFPPLLLGGTFLRTLLGGLRGQAPRQPSRLTLGTAWQNGLIEMLRLTPLAPAALVRIRILSRLYTARQEWAWLALALGLLAAIGVSHAVIVPPFPWLGGWGNWLVQLALVGLWGAALVIWAGTLSVFAVLNEITQGGGQVFPGVGWPTVAGSLFVIMAVSPVYVLLRLWVRFQVSGASMLEWSALAPLAVAFAGLVMAGLNYAGAQLVFHLRLRYLYHIRR
ncbi:MAG: hypothetical protein JXN59_12170 [Anaerolineae bacterium]|nr:hypothetical protein [Anaerolineae bacterium]